MKLKGASAISAKWMVVLCVSSFLVGMLFTNRMWNMSEDFEAEALKAPVNTEHLQLVTEIQCDPKPKPVTPEREVYVEVSKTHQAIRNLDKTISSLEMELAAVRAAQASTIGGGAAEKPAMEKTGEARQKVFVVIGINTAFSSRKRRDSIRETWMPTGEKRKQLEQEKGIIIKFVIGHSATPGGILDNAIEAEDAQHGDFLRLDHVEGYHELSSKTKTYFSTAVAKWDADYYVKVDDDVHINLGMLTVTLARHRSKPRAYIGCMKSGPVLAQKGVKYHEPEYWKFGEDGNRYFRHATGQVYAISRDLATYISINQPILHKYANEDVSLGSWFIGLDVDHIDDRSFCCGTPPDCEWKAQAGSVCVGSFDWTCSGICRSVERLGFVHQRCGEGDSAVWNAVL
ncbi:glycosyltransferase-like protein [Selaginella moellendorffii]|uniref:Hexosyltransferase n=1 Tax=Selaginella moellendorffii TaxID=88036 RepID=D8SZL4_SELML|nr:probable beta-1,3-galactosyltransferase 2 [Selaginella moellendorffii]EFJ10043.1 glycosyltransferase-like protein [Selaginella moellendorffii]|eukprot:XP_002988781.1 probable beta-1,3-galactosyltransferase 2 [Selaginella moellendorffii]